MSRLERLLREPLVHFACAGALLFGAYAWLHPERLAGEDERRIEFFADDLRQIRLAWLAQGRPDPTPEQMRHLIEDRIREEILYREALALGLDQGDTIVKRRLAQKMEFLFEDVSALREPSDGELAAFFAEHASRFAEPARVTFRQLYFSPDNRGARTRDDAARALETLARERLESAAAESLADPFMFQDYYGDRPFEQVASAFGPGFAEALFAAEAGSWQGPIESGYGWHLVYVDTHTPARTRELAEVEPDARRAWLEEQREGLQRAALEQMRARYEIVLPAEPAANGIPAP
ncbi:MAG: peptidylprolyl isomerase [Myxococcota bacterium]